MSAWLRGGGGAGSSCGGGGGWYPYGWLNCELCVRALSPSPSIAMRLLSGDSDRCRLLLGCERRFFFRAGPSESGMFAPLIRLPLLLSYIQCKLVKSLCFVCQMVKLRSPRGEEI